MVPQAVSVVPGQQIRMYGVAVGSVEGVAVADRGRRARLTLGLDDRAWPLHAGSRMRLRWGGTVSFDNRYIALAPSTSGPLLRQDGSFPSAHFTVPVELDTFLATFDGPTRRGLKTFFDNAGATFPNAAAPLGAVLGAAPAAVQQTSDLLADLDSNETALATLVRSGDGVINAIHDSQPGLDTLVSAAAQTLSATAGQAANIRASLQLAPSTLAQTRTTLAAAAPTLTLAATTLTRLSPGVTQLRALAPTLDDALRTVITVGPDATSTLVNLRTLVPHLNPLLDVLTERMPQLGSIGTETAQQLECIRPYTPDIVSWFTDWGGFMSSSDGVDRYLRANVEVPIAIPVNANSESPAQLIKDTPQLTYAFPRPPGYNAGQPWFLPQCGAGRDALNPADDPEYLHRDSSDAGDNG
jgi:ABC-type transporter Mla subunit MlaD